MGLPVIATNIGAMKEIVDDGENGYLIDVDDAQAFVDRLRSLIANRDKRIAMGISSRKKVEAHFGLKTNVDIIVEYLKRIATSPTPKR